MTAAHRAYRADRVAYTLHDRRLFRLGGYAADSPWTALTWPADALALARLGQEAS